jgi:hypothetical protein
MSSGVTQWVEFIACRCSSEADFGCLLGRDSVWNQTEVTALVENCTEVSVNADTTA